MAKMPPSDFRREFLRVGAHVSLGAGAIGHRSATVCTRQHLNPRGQEDQVGSAKEGSAVTPRPEVGEQALPRPREKLPGLEQKSGSPRRGSGISRCLRIRFATLSLAQPAAQTVLGNHAWHEKVCQIFTTAGFVPPPDI